MVDLLFNGPAGAPLLLLAPGAGAPMTSGFMEACARLLAERGVATARFEFAYMAARRTDGKRRPPPRAETLVPEYRAAVEAAVALDPPSLFIGGKSLGGRVASLVVDELYRQGRIRGLVCLGYPFHPPAKPAALRTAHLADLRCPTLICQGERDPFGTRDEVEGYALSDAIRIVWIKEGNHDLAPPARSEQSRAANLRVAADAIAASIQVA